MKPPAIVALFHLIRSLGTVVLVFVSPIAVLLGFRYFSSDELDSVTFGDEPLVVSPSSREERDLQRVNLTLLWKPGAVIRAPSWSGTVTSVYVSPGTELEAGRRVLRIDGVDRIAFPSQSPFYRPLEQGNRGPDVAMLHELLHAMGFIDSVPSDAELLTFATALAVERYNESLGIPGSRLFDPRTVIWLPFAPFPVASLDVDLGAPAPSLGSAIGVGPATLISATLQAQNSQERISLKSGVPYVVVKGKARLAFDPNSLALQADSLAPLAETVEPLAERTDAVIEREAPLKVVSVPSTAVVANVKGDLCAWVVDATSPDRYRPVEVTLAGGQAGVTNVATGLSVDDDVLANPSDVLDRWECP